jgi:tetratricopeptide (TPR) repeat protein
MKKFIFAALFACFSFHITITAEPKKSIEELKLLYQNAEYFVRLKDYSKAKLAYQNLLNCKEASMMDVFYFTDLNFRLSQVDKELGLYEEAENRLKRMLMKPLSDDLILRIKLLLGRVLQLQNKQEEAHFLLQRLKTEISFEKWPPEDRAYFVILEECMEDQFRLSMSQSIGLFEAGLYQESAMLLQEILQKIDSKKWPCLSNDEFKVLNLLAKAHFQAKNWGKIIAILQPKQDRILKNNEQDTLIYLIKAYKEIGALNQASELLKAIEAENNLTLDLMLEKGHTSFLMGDLKNAHDELSLFLEAGPVAKEMLKGKVFLAKTCLQSNDFKKIITLINEDVDNFSLSSDLYVDTQASLYELTFLLAEAFWGIRNYNKALQYYEKLLCSGSGNENCYKLSYVSLKLGYCHMYIEPQTLKSLEKAISIFKELEMINEISEEAYIAHASALKYMLELAPSEETEKNLKELLNQDDIFLTSEAKAEKILLIASIQKEDNEKERFYNSLIMNALLKNTKAAKKARYFLCMEDLKKGQKSDIEFLKSSLKDLENCFNELQDVDLELSSHILFTLADTLKDLQDVAYLEKALDFLQTLKSEPFFSSCKNKEEALFFHINLITTLCLLKEDEISLKLAEESLSKLMQDFELHPYTEMAIFDVASTFYKLEYFEKAEELFAKCHMLFPEGVLAAKSLYFAAFCTENLENEREKNAFVYRSTILNQYKDSFVAEESYLRLFSFSDYVSSQYQALEHLKAMPEIYPKSALLTITYYLLGLESKQEKKTSSKPADIKTSLTFFEKAIHHYNSTPSLTQEYENLIDDIDFIFNKSKIEFATLAIESQDKEAIKKSCIYLTEMAQEFSSKDSFYAKKLFSKNAFPKLYEENLFLLTKIYCLQEDEEKAIDTLNEMAELNKSLNIQRSYYQALAFFEMGCFKAKQQQHEKALDYFKQAENAANGDVLGSHQKLKIWKMTSYSLRYLGNYDDAMLYLSYVINENIPSSERIEAMLLRSELYALQGRHELAIKQLEAVSQKGGEFALIAKEKLKESYGHK